MTIIYIMCGLPFSGKTTISKAISKHQGIARISFDETWIEFEEKNEKIPGKNKVEQGEYIHKVCEDLARHYLSKGNSVVYDNLGHSLFERNKIKNIAKQVGAEAKIIYIDVPKQEVIGRRKENLNTKERSQVSDHNFNNALEAFEVPSNSEISLVYRSGEKIEVWLDKNLSI